MKLPLLIAAVLAVAVAYSEVDHEDGETKYFRNLSTLFKQHLFPFNTRLALEANYYSKGHFIISAHSIWYLLAPSEENAATLLNLPDDKSLRTTFYGHAFRLEGFYEGISFMRSQAVAVDETVEVKKEWHASSDPSFFNLPNYLQSAAFDKPFGHLQKFVGFGADVPYSSHTVLIDHLLFEGLWSSAFSDRAVQQGPFYNGQEPPASVEYLRMKGKLRVAEYPGCKVLEVPLGSDGLHTMLFAVGEKTESIIETVFSENMFADLKWTEEPKELVIPQLIMSSGLDMGPIFKNIKHSSVFNPAEISKIISDTPATSKGYFQVVTVNVSDSTKDESHHEEFHFEHLDEDALVINKPFLFSLFVNYPNTDVKIPVFTGMYSNPGEHGHQKVGCD